MMTVVHVNLFESNAGFIRTYAGSDGSWPKKPVQLETDQIDRCEELLGRLEDPDVHHEVGDVRELGSLLLDLLFGQHAHRVFSTEPSQPCLRGVLHLDLRDTVRLWRLPWEVACRLNAHGMPEYAFDSVSAGIVRQVREAETPPRTPPPETLRILVAWSSPQDLAHPNDLKIPECLPPLDALGEMSAIRKSGAQVFDVPAERSQIIGELRERRPHVFHLIAHGFRFSGDDLTYLVLQNADRCGVALEQSFLGEIFKEAGHWPVLLVLHACWSGAALGVHHHPGVGVLNSSLPTVVAFLYEANDRLSEAFSLTFYRLLAEGQPVDLAASEARRHMRGHAGPSVPPPVEASLDWMSPAVMTGHLRGGLPLCRRARACPRSDRRAAIGFPRRH